MKVSLIFLLIIVSLSSSETTQQDELTIMTRTSCLIISRHFVHTIQSKLSRLLAGSSQDNHSRSIWKLYGAMGQMCENNINQSEVQEFYSNNEDFDIQIFFYLVSDIDLLSVLSSTTLTEKEQEIVKFHQEFDARHNQERGEDKEQYLIDQN